MITDAFAHIGAWSHRPIGLGRAGLAALLEPYGVTRIYFGRLEALWFENPHDANPLAEPTQQEDQKAELVEVPVLDPTIATWRDELARLSKTRLPALVRLYPNYGMYTLTDADPLLEALGKQGIIAQVIVRMEDARRQHRRAQVPDVPVEAVLGAAETHPSLRILLSGASGPELRGLASRLPKANNLWADTAQIDGLGAVAALCKTAWLDRLVFGSHAPLFIPYSAVARVVVDLDDTTAMRILSGNPSELFQNRAAQGDP